MNHRALTAAFGTTLALGCSAAKREPLVLSIFDAPESSSVQGTRAPAAVATALGGLNAEVLQQLGDQLKAANDAAITRANPLTFQLDDDATGKEGQAAALQREMPAVTAAANLASSQWSAPGIRVELGRRCQPSAATCLPLLTDATFAEDTHTRRARGLAWALSHAAIVRAHGSALELGRVLRERLKASGTMALVFTATAGTLEAVPLGVLRAQAARAVSHLPQKAAGRGWLEAMAHAEPGWTLPVALEPDEIMVVPRLSALARMKDFEAELAKAGSFDWVVRPRG
jgi:hypothetical protein